MDQPHQDEEPTNRPLDTLRDGNIKATIWGNEGEKGIFPSTQLAKTYTDRDGNLQDTHSFSGTDLLRVAEMARTAYHRENELRRELQQDHEQSQDQAPPREDRKTDFRTRRAQGGGARRSPVPRREASHLSDRFKPGF